MFSNTILNTTSTITEFIHNNKIYKINSTSKFILNYVYREIDYFIQNLYYFVVDYESTIFKKCNKGYLLHRENDNITVIEI